MTPERYREIAGSFRTGVAVVTVLDAASRALPTLRRARCFVVNVLAPDAEEVSLRFASKADDKFVDLPWRGARPCRVRASAEGRT